MDLANMRYSIFQKLESIQRKEVRFWFSDTGIPCKRSIIQRILSKKVLVGLCYLFWDWRFAMMLIFDHIFTSDCRQHKPFRDIRYLESSSIKVERSWGYDL